MKRITSALVALPLVLLSLGSSGAIGETRREDEASLERDLTEAWIHGQDEQVIACQERIASFAAAHPDSARAHYVLGLAGLVRVLRPNGAPDNSDPAATLAVLDRSQEALARAHELDPSLADACVTNAFCILQRFLLGTGTPEDGESLGEWARKGADVGAERPSVRLLTLWLRTGQMMSTPKQIDWTMDQFLELGKGLRDEAFEGEGEPDFWSLFGQGMAARALLFSPRPRPRQAAELVNALLERSPDLHMAKAFLLPFVTEREPLAPATWRDLEWTELGGEPDPDGSVPGLADAAAVAYHLDEEGALLWIRIQLTAPPDESLFGINLVLDADGSQATGTPWWGGNTAFVFDRLASAWLARDDEGRYRGALGLTDDRGAMRGEMTNLEGEVAFGLDPEEEAFLLRLPWSTGGDGVPRFLLAVGSNSTWNDVVPNEGSFTLAP